MQRADARGTTTKKAVRLTDLVIDRVAFVPKGDNPGATIEFWKCRDPKLSRSGHQAPAVPPSRSRHATFERMDAVAKERFPELDQPGRDRRVRGDR